LGDGSVTVEICVIFGRNPLFLLLGLPIPASPQPPFLNLNGAFHAVVASRFDDDKGIIA
jgi:hypothetical protein